MGSTKDIPRTKMTYDEYTAYQELGALVGTIGGLSKRLEKRLRTVPGGVAGRQNAGQRNGEPDDPPV